MIFFGVVSFVALPIAAMMLVKADKLLTKTEMCLRENKRLNQKLELVKESK